MFSLVFFLRATSWLSFGRLLFIKVRASCCSAGAWAHARATTSLLLLAKRTHLCTGHVGGTSQVTVQLAVNLDPRSIYVWHTNRIEGGHSPIDDVHRVMHTFAQNCVVQLGAVMLFTETVRTCAPVL